MSEYEKCTIDPPCPSEAVEESSNIQKRSEEVLSVVSSSQMWAENDGSFVACEKSVKRLTAGQYVIHEISDGTMIFKTHHINTDSLMILPDSTSEEIIDGIAKFWTKEEHFKQFNFLLKRGILLYGPAGSGKTSTIQIISKMMIERDGIIFYVKNPYLTSMGLSVFRKIEPERPILLIFEDIDTIIQQYGEAELLALLDGELQINNIVSIATTNYMEKLDKRIKNRPSRFDVVKKIGMPNSAARRMFFLEKNPRLKHNDIELENWVKNTAGFSIAHLKEIIISCEILELSFDETLDRLNIMRNEKPSSDEDEYATGKFGFVNG